MRQLIVSVPVEREALVLEVLQGDGDNGCRLKCGLRGVRACDAWQDQNMQHMHMGRTMQLWEGAAGPAMRGGLPPCPLQERHTNLRRPNRHLHNLCGRLGVLARRWARPVTATGSQARPRCVDARLFYRRSGRSPSLCTCRCLPPFT